MHHITLCSIQLIMSATCFCGVHHVIDILLEICKVCIALSSRTNEHPVLALPAVSQGALVPLKNSGKSQITFITRREVLTGICS